MAPVRCASVGIFFLLLSIVSHYQTQALPENEEMESYKRARCQEKCGGKQAENEAFKDGKAICLNPSLADGEGWGGEYPRIVTTPCEMECMKQYPVFQWQAMAKEDQHVCFCKACTEPDPSLSYVNGFCSAPGVGRIGHQSECEKSFCKGNGNVKFYGRAYCESG